MKQLFDLHGRRALVTGSSRGIGKAIVLGLAESGADILINYASRFQEAESVAEEARKFGVKAYTVAASLGEPNSAKKIYEQAITQYGGIDILVLNASIQVKKPWLELSRLEIEQQVAVNLFSAFELMQLFTPGMIQQKWGRILTIGSVQQVRPHPQMPIYAATKVAQVSIVHNLAKQLAEFGITVNNLAPGVIDTDRNSDYLSDTAYLNQILAKIPSGYIGSIEDCVGAALLLCSDAGRYITGVDLMVDGGMHLG